MTKNVYLDVLKNQTNGGQMTPIAGREHEMVQNNAGGYTFSIDEMAQFKRWLILGSHVGTYYKKANALTAENTVNVMKLIKSGKAKEMLDLAVELSTEGRIVKLDQTFVLLAMVYAYGNQQDKKYAEQIFNKLIRTPYHLFQFLTYVKNMRGLGRSVRRVLQKWYEQNNKNFEYHLLKYRQRKGWRHVDIFNLIHYKPINAEQERFIKWYYDYFVGGKRDTKAPGELAELFVALQKATTDEEIVAILGRNSSISWEFIPTQFLKSKAVWETLMPNLPYTALIRNLPRLSALGLQPDVERIKSVDPKVHPFTLYMALSSYSLGYNKNLEWKVNNNIVDALEYAARAAFKNVPPISQSALIAIDVSGSMWWPETPSLGNMTPIQASGVMAQVVMSQFESVDVGYFADNDLQLFNRAQFGPETRFNDLADILDDLPWGGTDCALPMLWAKKNNRKYDLIIVFTDNETWYGNVHPTKALQQYRKEVGTNTGLIVCTMVPTKFTIADPADPKQVDICGADASLPKIIESIATEF